ncbi:protein tlpB [Flavobacterium sp. Sd200]|uniref:MauE/DoxX family redox-associated membrane protein n=1 Tax=Flavobacterium sp. Sd200 TaxID=2692211 RepID=UPI00136EFC76|nr:MauE/DoxX family redox-associated membrane protein [Flavobacterium sp. Sd200]MXN92993.1 protein tlpB [Flavobacterium sp. Sd200]
MKDFKTYLPYILRGIISFLFIISAIAKMYPSPYFAISTFEVKQLYPLGFSEELAVYFSRTLIGIEFALGFLLLQPHYLKKIVTPATILMLVVFIIHLSIETISNGGNSGNCGCFGSLLPMTPIEAIIKNIVAVGLLIWLYKLLPNSGDKTNFWVLTTVTLACILMVYMLAPIQPRNQQPTIETTNTFELEGAPVEPEITDTVTTTAPEATTSIDAQTTENPAVKATETAKPVANEPAQARSIYSQYFADADKGKKIVGLFAPGCEHCRGVAKDLTELRAKNKNFPELKIVFMDEESEVIPDFFKVAGAEYPYKVLDVISFWKFLGNSKDTPGVVYLWNGNKIAEWNGINEEKFTVSDFMKAYNKPYKK